MLQQKMNIDINQIFEFDNETLYSDFTNLNATGVFDKFYDVFLAYFNIQLIKIIDVFQGKDIKINKKNISISALNSLKNELMGICTKSILTEFLEIKEGNGLEGESSQERYNNFNNRLQTNEYRLKIVKQYPVLESMIVNKIHSKLRLINECISRLNDDIEKINTKFDVDSDILEDMTFSSGDSHNEGRSVLIISFASDRKIVYKPHSLQPEIAFNKLLQWFNENGKLKVQLKNADALDCRIYGWQEYIQSKTCENEEEIRRYFYRIGGVICLFNIIRTQDIHYENIISSGEFPMFIDLETMLCNQHGDSNIKGLLFNFLRNIAESVYGTLLIPQNLELAYFDIDISGISGVGGQKSEKIESFRLVNIGTDEIKYVKDFIYSDNQNNRPSLNNDIVQPSRYITDIETGFYDVYEFILQNKEYFIDFINVEPIFKGAYRQIMRPTSLYYQFIMAAQHPEYLFSFEEQHKLFSILKGKNVNSYENDKRINLEIESLMNNDIPYFWTDLESNDLFSVNGDCISNYYKTSIRELIINKICDACESDRREQLYYIKASLASTLQNDDYNYYKPTGTVKNYYSIVKSTLNKSNCYLDVATQIGEYILDTAIWNEEKSKCSWMALNTEKNNQLKFGILNYTLYEGAGVILFLAVLAKETGNKIYSDTVKSAVEGMEELFNLDKIDASFPFSAFHGIGSLAYLYFNLSTLSEDQDMYRKFLDMVNLLKKKDLEKETELDLISGAAGVVILCLNIYRRKEEELLLETALKYGEFLYNSIDIESKSYLTGFSHGYSGFSTALFMLYGLTREVKFLTLAMKLVMEENRYFSSIDANWMDLRHEKNHNGQLYWCHGAPGIALARAMSIQYGDQEDNNVLENDLEVAVEKLKKQGFENSLSHCLCHGVIGNLDILLEIATMRKDDVLKSSALKIGESILEDILEHGIKFSAPLNIETINFMIGLSGIGYCMLRLNNIELPSVLRLDVF